MVFIPLDLWWTSDLSGMYPALTAMRPKRRRRTQTSHNSMLVTDLMMSMEFI